MVNIEMGSNCNSESKDCITTYTGIHMNPLDPRPEDFRIEDIAHALPLICRGNGHVKTFFSVGQHCINCAREAEALKLPDRMVLACLLHDAVHSSGTCHSTGRQKTGFFPWYLHTFWDRI